jgi:hypothetical protein
LGQPDEAIASFGKAMAITDKSPQSIESSDYLRCMTHFFRARVWALYASAVGGSKAELTEAERAAKHQYADKAMKALRETTPGFAYHGMLNYERDFDVLRHRDDFQGLLRELEARTKTSP